MLYAHDVDVADPRTAYLAVASTGIAQFFIVSPTRVRLMVAAQSMAAAGVVVDRAGAALANAT